VREYIWLPEAEIAPTMGSRTQIDRSLAVVEAVNTVAPIVNYVHVDHLHRPVKMTSAAKATVWDAVWQPFGGLHAATGAASLNLRFPGQWFQSETGLHYNWHRSYDPTVGRYTQPDPLGFVDGPSVYGYAKGSPQRWVDPNGQFSKEGFQIGGNAGTLAGGAIAGLPGALGGRVLGSIIGGGAGYLLGELLKTEPIAPPAPKVNEDDCDGWDCERARRYHLDRAQINDEHAFKTDWGAVPNSRFDICACKNGQIVIRNVGQCGKSGPTISTTYTWR